MRFRVLTGLAVEGRPALDELVRLRPTPRAILAVLLLEEGGPESLLALHRKLGVGPKTVGQEASRLRVALGGEAVLPKLRASGHLELCLERKAVDLWCYRDHLHHGRHLRDDKRLPAAAIEEFEAAEALWAEADEHELACPKPLGLGAGWFRKKQAEPGPRAPQGPSRMD